MSLFGTDGIRDRAFTHLLSLENLFQIGQGIALFLKKHTSSSLPRLLIARDTRYSGPLIQSQLVCGLLAQGIRVIDGGVLPTPALSVLTHYYQADLGIMISASHNPAEDNGIKLINSEGHKLPPEWESELESLIQSSISSFAGDGQFEPFAGSSPYFQALTQRFQLPSFRVVLDGAHGAFSSIGPLLLRKLGIQVFPVACSPNGHNINQHCGALHPENIVASVLQEKADLGICLDGDGDRAIFVDDQGQIQDGDKILAILAVKMKEASKLPQSTIVSTIMCNWGLKQCLNEHHIRLIQTPVGDRHISEQIQAYGYSLGGEPSGHTIFTDHPTQTGDGVFTSLKVLEVMAQSGQKLSDLGKVMKTFPQILVNVRVKEKIPLDHIPSLQQALKEAEAHLADQGRVVLRYSGTENLLRIMVEGPHETLIHQEAQKLKDVASLVLA
ncbi:MAG: phosphoglucosamine mutase [Planctomycetota bacterium]